MLALRAKNRDAIIAILKSKNDTDQITFNNLNWKDGLQTVITLITCTAENCCKDYGRREIIQELLNENKLDFQLPEEFVNLTSCTEMKKVLKEWILSH